MTKNTGLACKNTHNKLLNVTKPFFHAGWVLNGRWLEQNGISEWKWIPEWNIYVELNGPYMGFRTYM